MITRQIQNPASSPLRFQRTDDSFLNATILLKEYNATRVYPNFKDMKDFKVLKSTKEFKNYIENELNVKNAWIASNKGTWMHPYMFLDFAMWLSVEFKAMALSWVYDGLINARNQSGDYAKELVSAIYDRHLEHFGCKPAPMVFMNEFKHLKEISGIKDRNEANEKELSTLNTLQKFDIKLIKDKVGKKSRYKQLESLAQALSI